MVKSFGKRLLKELFNITYDQDISEREILNNLFKESENIIERDIVELYDKKVGSFCVESELFAEKKRILYSKTGNICVITS